MIKPTAIIIGAGYSGMALANILGKAGYQVDVYEKNASPGGRIAVVKQHGFTFDLGPSWYLMPEVFEQYYQIFDTSAKDRLDLMRFSPGYKVFFEHHPPLVIQGDIDKDLHSFETIEPGAGTRLRSYVQRSTTAYNLAVKHFLYNNTFYLRDIFKTDIIGHTVQMLGLVVRSLDRYVSRYFHDLRLKQLLEYHMVFLGSSPFQAPAIYSLMSHLDYQSGVYYPRRGMMSLASDMQQLGDSYDIQYHYNQPVQRIIVDNAVATGVELGDGHIAAADIVISSADLAFTETRLLAKEWQSFPDAYWQKRQPGPGALLVSLGIKGSLPNLLHHNLYFVENWRQNFADIYETRTIPEHASVYICNPTKTDAGLAPKGHENIFVLVPLPAGVALNSKQKKELTKRVISIVGDIAEAPDIASRIVTQHIFGPDDFGTTFNAWQYNAFGGESHLLSQSIRFRTSNKSRKVRNLYYVGAGTLPGIGLPMCLISAQLTYKRIMGIKRPGPLTRELR